MNETKSQEQQILDYLSTGHSLTPALAYELFGTLRLSGRIFDLRKQGHDIRSERFTTKSGKHVANYSLTVGQLGLIS